MRHALTDSNHFVVSIVGGEKPADHWVDYPHDAPGMSVFKIRHLGGNQFEQTGESWLPALGYDMARSQAYPSVGDQLGAIWKAIAPLIENPEAEAILAKIQAVKDANPKPSN